MLPKKKIISADYLRSLIATAEILSDPESLRMLEQGLEDVRCGRLFDHDKIKDMLEEEERNV